IHFINKTTPPATPEDMIGKSVYNFMEGDYLDIFKKTLKKVFKTGSTCNYEIQVRGSNGHRWHNADIIPIKTDNKVSKAILVSEDITERKDAEEVLNESEERYRQISENIEEVFWIVSNDWSKVHYISPAYEKIWGRTCEGLYKKPQNWIEAILDEDKQKTIDYIAEKSSGEFTEIVFPEYRIKHVDGSIRWIRARGFPVLNNNGEIYRIAGIAEDITERKKAEEVLKASEKQLNQVYNTTSDSLALIEAGDDNLYRIVSFNDAYWIIIKSMAPNVTKEQFIGIELNELYSLLSIPESMDFISKFDIVRKTRKPSSTVEKIQTIAGDVYLETIVSPVLEDNKECTRILYSSHDITELKQAEEKLTKSLETVKVAEETAKAGSWKWDIKTNEVEWSDNLCRIHGIDPEEFDGSFEYVTKFFHPDDIEFINKSIQEMLSEKKPREFQYRIITADDNERHCTGTNNLMIDENGEIIEIVGMVHDITERKEAEDEKVRLLHEVGERVKELDCLYGLSKLIEKPGISLEEIFQGTVNLIPASLQYPDITCARLNIDGTEYRTNIFNCPETVRKLASDIKVHGKKTGTLTVRYLEERPELDEGPFLKEERNLIDAIAERLGRLIERIQAEETLQITKVMLERTGKMAKVGGWEKNLITGEDYWSEVTREIHEVEPDFVPSMENSIEFYKEGESRDKIVENVTHTLKTGEPFDDEFQIVTAKGNERWVRAIGNVEFEDSEAIRLFGTFQDVTERKNAELALRESEQKHRSLFETMVQGVIYQDADGNIISANSAAERILGLTLDQMQGRTSMDPRWKAIHEDGSDFPGDTHPISVTLRTGKEVRDTIMGIYHPEDDMYRWININSIPRFRPGDDKPFQVYVTFEDITERKKAEDALLKSEAQFRNVLDNSMDIVYEFNLETSTYDYISPSVEPLIGISDEDYIKGGVKLAISLLHPEDLEKLNTHTEHLLKGKLEEKFEPSIEYRIKNRVTNEWRWFSDKRRVVKKDGVPTSVIGVSRDITESKKSEEALRDSEVNLKEAQNVANMGSWAWDLKTNNVEWSDNLCLIHGMKPEDFDGTFETATSLIHPDDLERVLATNKHTQDEKHPLEIDYRIITKDGVLKFVRGTRKLIFDDKGNVIKMIGTLQDITERKQLEEQLQIRQRMDSLGTLAGGIAHDFNNILVGILGNIDLLNFNNENFTPDQKECLTDAGKSCNRAANLIRQFQTLSTGAVRGNTVVDIHDISNEVFNLLKEATDRLITKQIKFKKGEYFTNADSGELHQVLLNLATNSAQAIEERGAKEGDYIRIKAEDYESGMGDKTGLAEGDYVHISFADSGMGMSEEVLKKAFDPMFTTKEKGGKRGQGLGLAMAYNIITRIYDGHIWIDSKEGKGTTLHIYLPKAQPETETESKKTIDIKGGTETILVVDDEENVRKFTKKLLTQTGYTVITASDGKEALKIYDKQKDSIDTVILDLTMPQMSGKQVFQEMLEINPDVKVIISSGHGEEYSKKGILAEAKGNLGKPYKMKDLAKTVREVLDS
ncbi:MAG: PAS domain S-box protein, partial [bacterium]|nr:PAS domain S-box protein [bacterium]